MAWLGLDNKRDEDDLNTRAAKHRTMKGSADKKTQVINIWKNLRNEKPRQDFNKTGYTRHDRSLSVSDDFLTSLQN